MSRRIVIVDDNDEVLPVLEVDLDEFISPDFIPNAEIMVELAGVISDWLEENL